MNNIKESTACLVDQVLTYLKQQVITTLEPCEKNHQAELMQALENIPNPFSGIETEVLHAAYVKGNFNYVDYKTIKLGIRYVRRKKGAKPVITVPDESFIYIYVHTHSRKFTTTAWKKKNSLHYLKKTKML